MGHLTEDGIPLSLLSFEGKQLVGPLYINYHKNVQFIVIKQIDITDKNARSCSPHVGLEPGSLTFKHLDANNLQHKLV